MPTPFPRRLWRRIVFAEPLYQQQGGGEGGSLGYIPSFPVILFSQFSGGAR